MTVSWKSVSYPKDTSAMSGVKVAGIVSKVFPLIINVVETLSSITFFVKNYGLAGFMICTFGSREVWRIQVQILGSTRDSDAMDFKRSAQDDSNIIAVAVCSLIMICESSKLIQ